MKFFNKIVIRVNNFSHKSYKQNSKKLKVFFTKNSMFKFSVLVSSKKVFNEIDIYDNNLFTLDKYFSRAHFKPTPFATFSSIGLCIWHDEHTEIIKSNNLTVKVNYDNSLFLKFFSSLQPFSVSNLKYYSNPTIYFQNKETICYYQTKLNLRGIFESNYIELENDQQIEWIIDNFKNGYTLDILFKNLKDQSYNEEDINMFIDEVIQNGLLIDEISMHPYNIDKIDYLSKSTIQLTKKEDISLFELMKDGLGKLNNAKLIHKLIQYESDFNKNLPESIKNTVENIFSVTSFHEHCLGGISRSLQSKLLNYVNFCLKASNDKPINDLLKNFGEKFYNKYNDSAVPLLDVFNVNSGIVYESSIPPESKKDKFQEDINNKIVEGLSSGFNKIIINQKAGKELLDSLSPTCVVLFELLKDEQNIDVIYCKSFGGVSALNMITRFGEITDDLCKNIAERDISYYDNKILAELTYIPQVRSANILSTKQYYDYIIPLNTSYFNESKTILLSDLYLKHDGTRFILYSKEHKKEVIPRINSALAYRKDKNFPISEFLGDLQYQNNEYYYFDINQLNLRLPYIPELFLTENILLFPAQIYLILSDNFSFESFKIYFLNKIKKYKFSKLFIVGGTDGDLVLDSQIDLHIEYVLNKLKKEKSFYITQHVYDKYMPQVRDKSENFYTHEFIACLENEKYVAPELKFSFSSTSFLNNNNLELPLTSDWIYYELYSNNIAQDDVLKYVYKNILQNKKLLKHIDIFFFVRYNYPDEHIRLRFKVKNVKTKINIETVINKLIESKLISTFILKPYIKEIARYGGEILMELTERVFYIDSINFLKFISNSNDEKSKTIFSIVIIFQYLSFFKLDLNEMIIFCDNRLMDYSVEFDTENSNRKSYNSLFDEIKGDIYLPYLNNFLSDQLRNSDESILKELEYGLIDKYVYIADLIHMSMNRISYFGRLNEYKSFFLCKRYFNLLKHKK